MLEVHLPYPIDPSVRVSVVDDGRVAYAYFARDEQILGWVWLYNRGSYEQGHEPPFPGEPPRNAPEFVGDGSFEPPSEEDEFDARWVVRDGRLEAGLYLRGKLHAVVGEGDKPGWCVLARSDGPLAQELVIPSHGM